MIKLNKRLNFIANLVDERNVADVGCDHGKIILKLFEENKIDEAVISDISKPSLQKAIDLLNQKGFKKYKSYVCDGLSKYKSVDNIKQIIISGMGGLEIIQILKNSPIEINNVILQPQRNEIDVKKFLIDNKFTIVYDIIVEDKEKFYNIIKAKKLATKSLFTEFDLLFGKQNFENKSKDFINYLVYLSCKYETLLTKLTEQDKIDQINKLLENIVKAKQLIGECNE